MLILIFSLIHYIIAVDDFPFDHRNYVRFTNVHLVDLRNAEQENGLV